MSQLPIQPGDVVQIDPKVGPPIGGCFLIVTKADPEHVFGYVAVPLNTKNMPADAWQRLRLEHVQLVGKAHWKKEDKKDG